MSANDILDVLNIQRDQLETPSKKKQKVSQEQGRGARQSGMARELYNLLGPNTPPVSLSNSSGNAGFKEKLNFKPSPWTKVPFKCTSSSEKEFFHWVRGSKELLEQEAMENKPYKFEKFNVKIDIPDLGDESTFNELMKELNDGKTEKDSNVIEGNDQELKADKQEEKVEKLNNNEKDQHETQVVTSKVKIKEGDNGNTSNQELGSNNMSVNDDVVVNSPQTEIMEKQGKLKGSKNVFTKSGEEHNSTSENFERPWTYKETLHLFDLCKNFELKWPAIYDRYSYEDRKLEDLKSHFYSLCSVILKKNTGSNSKLIDALQSYSKSSELERKQYLENLLKRTPAEIAEEESLVIEARRFELAAKKMLIERSHLLTLLDSPQTSQSVLQYLTSQGLASLYNNLMIIDRQHKKRLLNQQHKNSNAYGGEPMPPAIPIAASSSFKKERNFQTQLQQYLASFLKQNISNGVKSPTAIQQLLNKRLTIKEEEAYGLHYHSNEKLTPGVVLRSSQKLPGMQQRQSVLKSVNNVLQELNIGTAGGTSWKPVMPTRKTMGKYDELLRTIVTLLEVKKARDKLEAEIRLIKSQRGLQ